MVSFVVKVEVPLLTTAVDFLPRVALPDGNVCFHPAPFSSGPVCLYSNLVGNTPLPELDRQSQPDGPPPTIRTRASRGNGFPNERSAVMNRGLA